MKILRWLLCSLLASLVSYYFSPSSTSCDKTTVTRTHSTDPPRSTEDPAHHRYLLHQPPSVLSAAQTDTAALAFHPGDGPQMMHQRDEDALTNGAANVQILVLSSKGA